MQRKQVNSLVIDHAPVTACTVSHMLNIPLDHALNQLRVLENQGKVRHVTDRAGVMRWERCAEVIDLHPKQAA